MSKNPYVQVALTYVRRPFSLWRGGTGTVGVSLFSVFYILIACRTGNRQYVAMPQLLPFAFVYMCLVVHAKDQFADSRARLTPGFRRAHALAGGTAAVLWGVVLPAVVAWLLHWHSIGFVAVTALLLPTILWMLLSMSGWLAVVLLLGWLSLCVEPGRECVQQLVTGKFRTRGRGTSGCGCRDNTARRNSAGPTQRRHVRISLDQVGPAWRNQDDRLRALPTIQLHGG